MHAAHCTLREGTWTRVSLATCPFSANLFTVHRIIIIINIDSSRGGGPERLGRDGLAGEGIGGKCGEAGARRGSDDPQGIGTGRGMGQGPAGESCPAICTCKQAPARHDRGGGQLCTHEGQWCQRIRRNEPDFLPVLLALKRSHSSTETLDALIDEVMN